MEKLYEKMGCVPRYVLQAAAIATELDQNLDNVAAAEKWAYSDVQKALDEVKYVLITLYQPISSPQ